MYFAVKYASLDDTWMELIALIVLARQDNCKPTSFGVSGRRLLQADKVKEFVIVFVSIIILFACLIVLIVLARQAIANKPLPASQEGRCCK